MSVYVGKVMSLEEPFDKPVDQGGGRGGETREGWVIRMEPGAGGGKGFAGLSTLRNGDGDAEEAGQQRRDHPPQGYEYGRLGLPTQG